MFLPKSLANEIFSNHLLHVISGNLNKINAEKFSQNWFIDKHKVFSFIDSEQFQKSVTFGGEIILKLSKELSTQFAAVSVKNKFHHNL